MIKLLQKLSDFYTENISHHLQTSPVVMNQDELYQFFKKAHASLSVYSSKTSIDKLHGEKISPYSGHGLDYSESRIYTPGDDIRSVNWKQSARTDQLITKLYHQENENIDYVFIDQRHPMFFGTLHQPKIATAIKTAIIAAISSLNSQKTIKIITIEDKINISEIIDSDEKILAYFNKIARKSESGSSYKQPEISNVLKQILSINPAGSSVILISDFHDLDIYNSKYIKSLSINNNVTLYQIQDHLEKSIPDIYPINYQSLYGDNSITLLSRAETNTFKSKISSDNSKLSDILMSLPAPVLQIENSITDTDILNIQERQWI